MPANPSNCEEWTFFRFSIPHPLILPLFAEYLAYTGSAVQAIALDKKSNFQWQVLPSKDGNSAYLKQVSTRKTHRSGRHGLIVMTSLPSIVFIPFPTAQDH
jgi:hypothetical protein